MMRGLIALSKAASLTFLACAITWGINWLVLFVGGEKALTILVVILLAVSAVVFYITEPER